MSAVLLAVAALASACIAAVFARSGWSRALWCLPILFGIGAGVLSGAFIVKKAIGLACMPSGLLCMTGFITLLWLLAHGRHGPACLVFGLWLLFSLAGNIWVGGALLNQLEAPYAVDPSFDPPLDLLIVLGGGTTLRPDGEIQAGPSGDRIMRAALLFHAGKVKRLLASGTSVGGITQARPRDLGDEARQLWVGLGVPDAAIITLPGPRNTAEEMQVARAWLIDQSLTEGALPRVGVLTSAWHLRRTLMQAHHAGLDVIPVASDFRGGRAVPNLMGLVPSGHGFYRTRLAVWEYLGGLVAPSRPSQPK
ncbi:MAG: uncharacterized SAM-binding protein YcdF (DUF218 family) [Bradymonadia bacterium]|jgi:uncharacterized SAM-binding protein YcdF (DUF218 family)